MKTLTLPHGEIQLPAFFPDATRGVVRSIDMVDVANAGVQAAQMNVFHLMRKPGTAVIDGFGGVHKFSNWQKPIILDSGGFQIFSLIHERPNSGSISDKGATFLPEGSKRKMKLTPEKSIQIQVRFGSDIVVCLDDCTHVDAPLVDQETSVRRTIAWAKRCRKEFDRLMDEKKLEPSQRPKLYGVVQGGGVPELRKQCADALLEIGFDGYGYGGWPLDKHNNLLFDMLSLVRDLIPREFGIHALGVGHPDNVVACARVGYTQFDSTMPTRDARHGRLYSWESEGVESGDWRYLYIKDDTHLRDVRPISPLCDCHACSNYALGYLHHLYSVNDPLYQRLATIHNLRFMTMLMARLRAQL